MVCMEYPIKPKIAFILPVQNKQNLVIEQINSCFKFSEWYSGFCEIIIVTDDFDDKRVHLFWLALRLNKVSHSYVRIKMIRYTAKRDINELIETGLKHATGQKMVVILTDSDEVDKFSFDKISNIVQSRILMVPHFLDSDTLKETLHVTLETLDNEQTVIQQG